VSSRVPWRRGKNPDAQFVVVGKKGVMKLEGLGHKLLKAMRMSRTAVFMKWLFDIKTIFSQRSDGPAGWAR